MRTGMKLRLEIEIEYELTEFSGEDAEGEARSILLQAANFLAGNGMLTQDSELCVATWESRVLRMEP
jgi:hypothetical protein